MERARTRPGIFDFRTPINSIIIGIAVRGKKLYVSEEEERIHDAAPRRCRPFEPESRGRYPRHYAGPARVAFALIGVTSDDVVPGG